MAFFTFVPRPPPPLPHPFFPLLCISLSPPLPYSGAPLSTPSPFFCPPPLFTPNPTPSLTTSFGTSFNLPAPSISHSPPAPLVHASVPRFSSTSDEDEAVMAGDIKGLTEGSCRPLWPASCLMRLLGPHRPRARLRPRGGAGSAEKCRAAARRTISPARRRAGRFTSTAVAEAVCSFDAAAPGAAPFGVGPKHRGTDRLRPRPASPGRGRPWLPPLRHAADRAWALEPVPRAAATAAPTHPRSPKPGRSPQHRRIAMRQGPRTPLPHPAHQSQARSTSKKHGGCDGPGFKTVAGYTG